MLVDEYPAAGHRLGVLAVGIERAAHGIPLHGAGGFLDLSELLEGDRRQPHLLGLDHVVPVAPKRTFSRRGIGRHVIDRPAFGEVLRLSGHALERAWAEQGIHQRQILGVEVLPEVQRVLLSGALGGLLILRKRFGPAILLLIDRLLVGGARCLIFQAGHHFGVHRRHRAQIGVFRRRLAHQEFGLEALEFLRRGGLRPLLLHQREPAAKLIHRACVGCLVLLDQMRELTVGVALGERLLALGQLVGGRLLHLRAFGEEPGLQQRLLTRQFNWAFSGHGVDAATLLQVVPTR